MKVLLKEELKLQLCMTHSSLGKNVCAPLSVNTFNMNNIDILYEAKKPLFSLWQSTSDKFRQKGLRHNLILTFQLCSI